jgi:hypothetical protein
MAERVDKPELVQRVARRLDRDGETVAEIVDGLLEEIYAALKHGDSVSLRGFGSFYVRAAGLRRSRSCTMLPGWVVGGGIAQPTGAAGVGVTWQPCCVVWSWW